MICIEYQKVFIWDESRRSLQFMRIDETWLTNKQLSVEQINRSTMEFYC